MIPKSRYFLGGLLFLALGLLAVGSLYLPKNTRDEVPKLISQLENEDWKIRWNASEKLGEIGPLAESALPALLKAVFDEEWRVRWYSVLALGNIEKVTPAVVDVLCQAASDTDDMVRQSAFSSLQKLGHYNERVMEVTLKGLKDEQIKVRENAIKTLSRSKFETSGITEALIPLIKSSHNDIVQTAISSLGKRGSASLLALPHLEQAFTKGSRKTKTSILKAVGQICQDNPSLAFPLYKKSLEDSNKRVRASAAYGVGRWKEKGKELVPYLLNLIKKEGEPMKVKLAAIGSLGEIGPEASSALEYLEKNIEHPYVLIRVGSIEAMGKIGLSAVPILLKYTTHPDEKVRGNVIYVLGIIKGYEETFLPTLLEATEDKTPYIRYSAARSFAHKRQDSKKVRKVLINLLQDPALEVRYMAAKALSFLGDSRVVNALRKALKDKRWHVRYSAAKSLGHIKEKAKLAVDDLIHLLIQDKRIIVRTIAARSLGKIGDHQAKVIDALHQARKFDNNPLREAIDKALSQLGQ